jgi:hypothetical protein
MANQTGRCGSYAPGHNVHFIQANVQSHHPRVWAKVELIGPKAVRVITQDLDEVYFHHDAITLYMYTLVSLDGEVKFAPNSGLLYIHMEKSERLPQDAWIMAHLSRGEVGPCTQVDHSKSYGLSDF